MLTTATSPLPLAAARRPAASAAASVTRVLTLTYGVVPIVAGLDKFANLLTNWETYVSPGMAQLLPVSAHTFMMVVGIIEIVAGVLVLLRPRIGAWVVMAWLISIGTSLVMSGQHFDVAVRDFVLAVGAWALARLSARGPEQG